MAKTVSVRLDDKLHAQVERMATHHGSETKYIRSLIEKDIYPEYKTAKEIMLDELREEVGAMLEEELKKYPVTENKVYKVPDTTHTKESLQEGIELIKRVRRPLGDLTSEGAINIPMKGGPPSFPDSGNSLLHEG